MLPCPVRVLHFVRVDRCDEEGTLRLSLVLLPLDGGCEDDAHLALLVAEHLRLAVIRRLSEE